MRHGGDISQARAQFGGTEAQWLDLSTGINPTAYPIPQDLPLSCWTDLPEQSALDALLSTAVRAYACPEGVTLAAAPGTQAILARLPDILPAGPVAILSPTYMGHSDCWQRAGRTVQQLPSLDALPENTRILVLVNPNNPDGKTLSVDALLQLADRMRQRGGYLIVDEAFADPTPELSLIPHLERKSTSALVLRSFGKFYGLAGLRLGFLVGPDEITSRLADHLESWAVSGPALEIGRRALADTVWQQDMCRSLLQGMSDLTNALTNTGLEVIGNTPLFALVRHPEAHRLHHELAKRHIWLRKFDYASDWLRIGPPGSAAQCTRLANAIRDSLAILATEQTSITGAQRCS